MSQNPETSAHSMRFTIDEVLSGMLATIERDHFTDDTEALGQVFKGLAAEGPLFAPFAAVAGGADFSVIVEGALEKLVKNGYLEHPAGRYRLTPVGRAKCLTSKRTLFSASDIRDLEKGAVYFDAHTISS
ncbi:MAG: hypothetical protein ABI559_05630 [Chloroflexota bacterium]